MDQHRHHHARLTGAHSCESHTYLEIARGVQQNVAGLEVAVQHVGRVDVLEATQYLVYKVADVVSAQALGLQQLV